ncbi:SDR family NAD(P)-dependent oxidoreductase [Lactiplantibacillus paraplantarum]|uniref:SDR family NAD(P)-dependent oxidoreductase n=1 Tax=Lactiplantibacillus paraplantarum TaxID=60520 RepID=UPI003B289CCD
MKKVVAITGASSGMGLETTKLMADNNWIVYGGARHIAKIPTTSNIHSLKLDVTDTDSNQNFINTIISEQGHIDALINSAGYGELGPVEDIPIAAARQQFATNFFGAAELTKLVLPQMRKQQHGRIVNISSVGGDIYSPLGAYYHASKAALQQWSDTLDLEVQRFNIRSVVVQPSGTHSTWGPIARKKILQNTHGNPTYTDLVDLMTTTLADNARGMSATATDLAQIIFSATTDKHPHRRYFNTFHDRLTVFVARTLPNIFRRQIQRSIIKTKKQS